MRLQSVLSFTAAFFSLFIFSNGQSKSPSVPPTPISAIPPKDSGLSVEVSMTPGSSGATVASLAASTTISDCPAHRCSDSLGGVTSYAASDQQPVIQPFPCELSSSSRVTITSTGLWNFRGSPWSAETTTGVGPALAEHNGWLFALYTNKATTELWWARGNNDGWYFPVKFIDTYDRPYPLTVMPALASFGQSLHAVVDQPWGEATFIRHLIFNDTIVKWNLTNTRLFQESYMLPALATYHGQLFLAMASPKGELTYSTWTPVSGWTNARSIPGVTAYGRPAMYVQNDTLYLLFPGYLIGPVLSLVYKNEAEGWSSLTSLGENTYEGVSATSSGGMAFVGFNTADPFPRIFVKVNNGSNWGPHEIPGQSASNTPTLAVLDDVLNVIFDSNNNIREVLWLQRTLTNYSLESWMSAVANSRLISSLSIPGTHDSAAVSSFPSVGTQTMSITEQLNAGVRYLDLRCGLIYNRLIMFHGLYNLGFTLKEVITGIQSWLTSHPTEAVIVQIKEDPDPTDSTISFATAVERLIGTAAGLWNTSATLPRLQDIRNRIQLVRRYPVNATAGEKAIGIDLSQGWKDNNPSFSFVTPSGIKIVAQDQYKYDERLDVLVSRKFAVLDALMEDAADDPLSTTWYINFASATHTAPTGIFPDKIAVGGYAPGSSLWVPGVNTRLRNKLYGLPTHKRYGTILMDYPESPDGDLIARIVADNM